MPVKSYVNQPDRVFINSSDDITTPYNGQFNQFQANFITPIMNAERCQLLRATIPTPGPALPDYALEFWYAKKDTIDEALDSTNVKVVRILPYGFVPTSGTYAINRYLASYTDFVSLLNLASLNDNSTYNPYWGGAGDLIFALDSTTNKISITGEDDTKFYQVLGYGSYFQEQLTGNIVLPPGNRISPNAYIDYISEYNLNLRVGFAMPASFTGYDAEAGDQSRFPTSNSTVPSMKTVAGGVAITADSYPNLVRTQAVYFYSNIAVASAMGSNNRHNLLAVIPVNSPALGVTNYTALTINFLTKVANDSIQNINIEMLDDANLPYTLPDNAQVNLEIAFKYCD
jgi:hypothetical protein